MRENESDHESISLVKIWTPAIVLTVLVMIVALIPNGQLGIHFGNLPRPITDGGHLVGFVIYGMTICYTISVKSSHLVTDSGAVLIAIFTIVALAIISELSQNFVNRNPSLSDVIIDALGGALGISLTVGYTIRKKEQDLLKKAARWT